MNGMALLKHLKASKDEQSWADVLDNALLSAEHRGFLRGLEAAASHVGQTNITPTLRDEPTGPSIDIGPMLAAAIRALAEEKK